MNTEDYNKVMEVLKNFPDYEEKYKKSALFHQVVQMMARGLTPYEVIIQLITITEDTQKAFELYMSTH